MTSSPPEPPSVPPPRCYCERVNVVHASAGSALAVCGMLSLWFHWNGLSLVTILMVDGYIAGLLFVVAVRSDGCTQMSRLLPDRLVALLLFGLLFATIVPSFANLYIASGDVCQNGNQDCLHACTEPLQGSEQATDQSTCLTEMTVSAVYFSLVTMTTVGYGDYTPKREHARKLVIVQICSGILLFILAFPLLISRMAAYR